MNDSDYKNRILKLLARLKHDVNTPDMHSFMARIKGGTVFVEAWPGEVFIDHERGGESKSWRGTYVDAAKRLAMLGLDLDTVDI